MLNKDSQVKSAFGISDLAPTGENVVQGGGGLISALNVRKTMTAYFSSSDSEISYGSFPRCYIRMIPLILRQDWGSSKRKHFNQLCQTTGNECGQMWNYFVWKGKADSTNERFLLQTSVGQP